MKAASVKDKERILKGAGEKLNRSTNLFPADCQDYSLSFEARNLSSCVKLFARMDVHLIYDYYNL